MRLVPITAVTYVVVWVALVVLAALSLGLSYLELGDFGVVVAMSIGAVKAALIALFFMHLAEGRFAYRFVLAIGVAFVVIMVGLTALDILTRHAPAVPPLR